jgi:hypothetical protein
MLIFFGGSDFVQRDWPACKFNIIGSCTEFVNYPPMSTTNIFSLISGAPLEGMVSLSADNHSFLN